MALTTGNATPILTPAEVAELLITPVERESVAAQLATVVRIDTKSYRVPKVTADPTASWVAEGEEITPSDATFNEVTVTPSKVAGLTIISRELAEDSTPEADQVVGDGLARDIARKVDTAFFGNVSAPAPPGLGSLATTTGAVQTVSVAGTAFANLDWVAAAQAKAEAVGVELTGFAANPADVLILAQLKEETGSNKPLLGSDPTRPAKRLVQGLQLLSTPDVAAGTVWGIAKQRVLIVVRRDATVESDRSVFFTSDRVAVKATMRVGFGFPHLPAIVKISLTGS